MHMNLLKPNPYIQSSIECVSVDCPPNDREMWILRRIFKQLLINHRSDTSRLLQYKKSFLVKCSYVVKDPPILTDMNEWE